MEIEIIRYRPELSREWDELVERSHNGTFLHKRQYMDYHSDRFKDCSLLAYVDGRLLTVLPANEEGRMLCSHRGLTYGGWLMPARRCDTGVMADVVAAMVRWMRDNGFDELVYKPVPHIYHRYPAEDDIYALCLHGAELAECSISTTIDLANRLPMDRGNKSGLNVARRAGVVIAESNDWEGYWHLLEDVLAQRHAATPVHTAAEMRLLKSRFPENIRLYTATINGEIVAGVIIYLTPMVAHCQYIGANERGRETHALTLLMDRLVDEATQRGQRFFDFGISTEDHGRVLNRGLMQQKSRLGGRGTVTQVYRLKTHR